MGIENFDNILGDSIDSLEFSLEGFIKYWNMSQKSIVSF
jgi:hypothetical protein